MRLLTPSHVAHLAFGLAMFVSLLLTFTLLLLILVLFPLFQHSATINANTRSLTTAPLTQRNQTLSSYSRTANSGNAEYLLLAFFALFALFTSLLVLTIIVPRSIVTFLFGISGVCCVAKSQSHR